VTDDPLRARLRRLRREPEAAPAPEEASAPAADRATGDPVDLIEEAGEHGVFALRRVEHDAGHVHGAERLAAVDAIDRAALALVARDEALADFDARTAIYLDIETTGLSGGAGTIPFQVGLGWFEGPRFVLWQGLLRHPGEEAAMLAETARLIERSSAVVSFFGKVFDRHRLEDKMRMHGVAPPFEGRPHLDLYHPLRRLYGGAFPDGRLSTMETALCGVARDDDLPGRFAPEAWYDWLAGRPHRLEGVLRHNADDVLSLVTLAAHAGGVLDEARDLRGPAGTRAHGLARLLHDARRDEEALPWLERALGAELPDPRAAGALHGRVCKRLKRAGEAAARWRELSGGQDVHALEAALELARDAEHRLRDPAAAQGWCARARAVLAAHPLLPGAKRAASDLDRREARLAGKPSG
jgi:uncharacterized protein YprB with RNaseH-like and TPR domain